MNIEICLATSNEGKLREYREILAPMGYVIYSPKDLGIVSDPIENGTTYRENALIKARDLASKVPFPVLSDDSGLEISALDGKPGIHTARYAKEKGGYAGAFEAILAALKGKEDRSARFVCCICYLSSPQTKPLYFEGVCPGSILPAPVGEHGFGYDPLFHSFEADADFGTASEETKNRFSHRGKAIKALGLYLSIKE